MAEWIGVYLTVWIAVAGWFAGSWFRLRRFGADAQTARRYRQCWLAGSTAVVLHIVASYGWVHQFSHQAAIMATAETSERVVGIRAGWGVYVNWVFAVVWFAYSVAMMVVGGPLRRWDRIVFWLTATVVFFATVVFENGPVRWISATGFAALVANSLTFGERLLK